MNTKTLDKKPAAAMQSGLPILKNNVAQYLSSHPTYEHYQNLLHHISETLGAVEVRLTAGNCIVHIAVDKPKRPNRFIEMTKTAAHLEFRLRHDGSYHDPKGWLQLKDWQGASLPPLRRYFYFTNDSDLDYALRLISASYQSIMPSRSDLRP